ncbi:hypothetical protein NK55_08030 [Thermosynechococcus sp. NK55a]|jgi:hypothetical protein|uniref:DUF3318 domain-containing protein n=1 Tax=Thermosynechococcus sp. NK55a TaxID=1394889 RepID=UPI0003D81F41|nr:DUF3318 domain-containing protein [Thermosynechococcus sp. NK55a]AHB88888.1 hypothetical protein NK55_08030 [Thermosynechococcus sp. NK55a]
MTPEAEIHRLLDLMPASARMRCKLVSRPQQSQVLRYQPPLPWGDRPIEINFRLWQHLDPPERDLLLLRAVAWFNTTGLIKLDLYQGLTVAGLLGTLFQAIQADPIGILVAGGLTTFAGLQVWQNTRGIPVAVAADRQALLLAQRRGYSEQEAAKALLSGISRVAELERRPVLDVTELIRCQNLRQLAGESEVKVPV